MFNFLFSPKGRFTRRDFSISLVASVVIFLAYLWFVARHLGDFPPLAMLACGFAILYIFIIGNIKRFHDFGYSGWTAMWLPVVPVYLYFFFLLIWRVGDTEENEYGLPPGVKRPPEKKDAPVSVEE